MKLEPTTDIEIIKQCQAGNYVTWGPPLTLEQYQDRDWKNYNTDYMNLQRDNPEITNGGVYFILKNQNGDIESSCEILLRDCWIKTKDNNNNNNNNNNNEIIIINAKCAVIGSVYTIEKYRGKGNGNIMMNQLNKLLDSVYLTGPYDVAFLYSEVGEYYSKFEYQSYHVPVIKLDIEYYKNIVKNADFNYEQITDFTEVANDFKEKKMIELQKQSINNDDEMIFMLKPTASIFEWFSNRSHTSGYLIRSSSSNDSNDTNNILNYVIFTTVSSSTTILALYATNPIIQDQLLSLVSKHHSNPSTTLSIWETDLSFANKIKSIETIENSSLSAARTKISNNKKLVWAANGKWCWF
jgi:hypothetical protein